MVWAIVVVAIGVLGVAAWAGTGRLGEMPGPVTDRPKAHVPARPVDEGFLSELSLPIVTTGYRRSQVDELFTSLASGADVEPGTRFDVVRHGYDMQAVDAVIERISAHEHSDYSSGVDSDEGGAPPSDGLLDGERASLPPGIERTPLSGEVPEDPSTDAVCRREPSAAPSGEPRRAVFGESTSP